MLPAVVGAPVTRDQIDRLHAAMLAFPPKEFKTNHYSANGLYVRTIWSAAGDTLVGKVHKTEHIYGVLTGIVQVTIEGSVRELNATRDGPQIITCPIGTKRAVAIIEDAWRLNVFLNPDNLDPENFEDLAELEDRLVEEDPTSPYLPGNKLRSLP